MAAERSPVGELRLLACVQSLGPLGQCVVVSCNGNLILPIDKGHIGEVLPIFTTENIALYRSGCFWGFMFPVGAQRLAACG